MCVYIYVYIYIYICMYDYMYEYMYPAGMYLLKVNNRNKH